MDKLDVDVLKAEHELELRMGEGFWKRRLTEQEAQAIGAKYSIALVAGDSLDGIRLEGTIARRQEEHAVGSQAINGDTEASHVIAGAKVETLASLQSRLSDRELATEPSSTLQPLRKATLHWSRPSSRASTGSANSGRPPSSDTDEE